MSFFDDAISTLGRGLAQSAVGTLSDETGFDVGGTLNALFGNGQPTGGADLTALQSALQGDWGGSSAQLQMLTGSINQQTQMIAQLGTQLTGIANAVKLINDEIAGLQQLLQKINQEQLYEEWQAADDLTTQYLAAIQSSYFAYGSFTSAYAKTPTDAVNRLANDILDTNDGPGVGLNALSQLILDNNQKRGLLQLWSNMVTPLVAGGLLDYRDAVNQYMAYYQTLAYAQLQATNLVMEAYNLLGPADQAKAIWKQYRAALLAQENTFITWLVPLVAAGVPAQVNQGSTYNNFSGVDAAAQLNPGVQHLPGAAVPGNAYFAPSAVFKAAENLLATLYVTAPADRRIVVHMVYVSEPGISTLLAGVALTLTQSGLPPVPATSSAVLGAPFPLAAGGTQLPDFNFQFNDFYIKRFVFSADDPNQTLADGQYTLADLNGVNGLVPMATYLSDPNAGGSNPEPPFMNQNVLAYPLSIDGTTPFDFMNFMAYMVPVLFPGALG
jgi:hypothetical protein